MWAAQALRPPRGHLGPPGPPALAWPPHLAARYSPTEQGVVCPVLLGTFPGTRAGLSPAAQKVHAQGCAAGSASLSQKRGLGSQSEPCSGGRSLTLRRRAGRARQG